MEKEIKASVICNTYNHERYIAKCLESLVSQKTDFYYEIIVHDDASTDSTAEIIREYEKKYPMIRALYESENQFSKGVSMWDSTGKYAAGKYFAICEGDDFWVAPDKLQKQVDFMESHPEYSLCGHAAYCAFDNDSLSKTNFMRPFSESKDVTMSDIIRGWAMPTNSFLFQTRLVSGTPPYQGECRQSDFALMTFLALQGKVYYMNELMSAYRIQSATSWTRRISRTPEVRRKMIGEFIAMLDRFDDYTGGTYHSDIEERKKSVQFNLAVGEGRISDAKQAPELYRALSLKRRMKMYVAAYVPQAVTIAKRAVDLVYSFRKKPRK